MSTPAGPVDLLTRRADPRGRPGVGRRMALVCLGCAVVLIPWVAYLATSLPQTYVLANWNSAWVGFDVLLMALLGTTGVLARRAHPLHVPAAFASAAFLVADAWFDVMTSSGSAFVVSLAAAAIIELPLAAFLLRYGTRVVSEAVAAR